MAQIKIYRNENAEQKLIPAALGFTVDGNPVSVLADCSDTQLIRRITAVMKVFGTDMTKADMKAFIGILTADDDVTVVRDMVPVVKVVVNGGGPNSSYEHTSWGTIQVVGEDLSFIKKIGEELGILLSSIDPECSDPPALQKIKVAVEAVKTIHGYSVESIEVDSTRKYRDELVF